MICFADRGHPFNTVNWGWRVSVPKQIPLNLLLSVLNFASVGGCFIEMNSSVGGSVKMKFTSIGGGSKFKVPSSPCTYVLLE